MASKCVFVGVVAIKGEAGTKADAEAKQLAAAIKAEVRIETFVMVNISLKGVSIDSVKFNNCVTLSSVVAFV